MTEHSQEWFIEERTRALAMVHLTRRDDLAVSNAGPGLGLQLIVSIAKRKGEPSLRQFGVCLHGARSATTEAELDKALRPAFRSLRSKGEYPYPACLFHFSMDDDQGYYAWVAEPAVVEAGPRLLMHDAPHCRKLDRAALDEIVAAVDAWYDAFFARIAVKAS
jgi:hypothetical protein